MPTSSKDHADANRVESGINAFWDKLGLIPASLSEARRVLEVGMETGDCTCLIGEAGIGKTQIMKQIAEDHNMRCVFFYLAHVKSEDIGGIPYPAEGGRAYRFLCEENILDVIEDDRETLLVLDEWNRGEKPVMAAAFTMMESRRFGSVEIPPNVHIVACMNPSEGSYIVNEAEQDPAYRRRMCFIAVHATIDTWRAYAAGRGKFHRSVVEFIAANPRLLNDVRARDAGMIYSNPAALEKLSNTVRAFEKKAINFIEDEDMAQTFRLKATGHIGATAADRFVQYLQDNATLIDPQQVVRKYKAKAQAAVLHLVDVGRTDVLMELADNVALLLISDQPDAAKIARHIAAFCSDLPEDPLVTFLGKLRKYAREMNKLGPGDYYGALNRELNETQAFADAISNLDNAVHKISERSE